MKLTKDEKLEHLAAIILIIFLIIIPIAAAIFVISNKVDCAYRVHTNSGTYYTSEITYEENGWVLITTHDGRTLHLNPTDITDIEELHK